MWWLHYRTDFASFSFIRRPIISRLWQKSIVLLRTVVKQNHYMTHFLSFEITVMLNKRCKIKKNKKISISRDGWFFWWYIKLYCMCANSVLKFLRLPKYSSKFSFSVIVRFSPAFILIGCNAGKIRQDECLGGFRYDILESQAAFWNAFRVKPSLRGPLKRITRRILELLNKFIEAKLKVLS